jgi:hypothetical protein
VLKRVSLLWIRSFGVGSATKFTLRGEFLGTTSRVAGIREPTSIAIDSEHQV